MNSNNTSLKDDIDHLNIELNNIKDALVKEKDQSNDLSISNTKYIQELEDTKMNDEDNQVKLNDIIEELNLKISELKDNLSESNNSNEHLVIEVILLLYIFKIYYILYLNINHNMYTFNHYSFI